MAIDTVGPLLSPLLGTLERVIWVQRHLHPPLAERLADALAPATEAVSTPLGALQAAAWPEDLVFLRERLVDVAGQTLEMVGAFVAAARGGGEIFDLYRALRRFARVQETLYPLAPVLDAVSRWFLESARREDEACSTGSARAPCGRRACGSGCYTRTTSATPGAGSRSTSRSRGTAGHRGR